MTAAKPHRDPDDVAARSPVREMLVVALPAVITMSSYSVMQFVDSFFVSQLGPAELGATGNGGIAAFVPASVMMGLLGIINTYVSQNLGAGKPERGAAYAWNGLWIAASVWALVLVPMAVFLPQIFEGARGLFGIDEVPARVAELEAVYGRILLGGMILTLCARGISHYFYGMHRPAVVMVATLSGNLVNLVLTYALVFGSAGAGAVTLGGSEVLLPGWGWLPFEWASMGVAGAAAATVFGGAVEVVIPMALFLSGRYAREFGTRRAWKPSWARVRDIVKLGWPPAVMFGNEMICWYVLMAVFTLEFDPAGAEPVHNPAGWIALRYMHLSFMPAVGLSIAVTALVGRCMGAGRPDLAVERTKLGLAIALGYMGVCAVCFVVFREPMMDLFVSADTSAETRAEIIRVGGVILLLAAGFQVFDALAITLSGALRGAGDTVWPGLVTIVLSWTCIIGGGWLFVEFAPGLGSAGPWIAASAFIVLLALALTWRFVGGAWKRISLVEGSEGPGGGMSESRRMAVAAARKLPADAGEGALPAAPVADVPDVPDAGVGRGPVEPGPRDA